MFSIKQRQHVFIFECVLALFIPIELTLDPMISHLIFLVLFVTKIKLESTRVTIIFIIITQILMSLYCIFHTLPLLILYFTAQISTLFSIYFLPVYQYPTPSGPYNVGYKQIQNIYIYYPTDQIKSVDIKQIQGVDYIRRIYDSYQHIHKNRIPSIVLRVFLQFIQMITLRVAENALITNQIHKFNVIVFSNGLNGLINHYSILLKDWASRGYIVFGIQLDESFSILSQDEIHSIRNKKATLENEKGKRIFDKIKQIRNQQLLVRVEKLQTILNDLQNLDQTLIIKGLSNNSIDWGKIILSGHSFGGAAAFELAARDRRISSLLLFDPWFYPLSEELINNADIEATIFCINSESFRKRKEAQVIELNEKIFNQQKNCLVLMIKESHHLAITDLPYLLSSELSLIKKLDRNNNILELTRIHLEISNLALSDVQRKERNLKNTFQKIASICDQIFRRSETVLQLEFLREQFNS